MNGSAHLELRQQRRQQQALAGVAQALGLQHEAAKALGVRRRKSVQLEVAVAEQLLPHALQARLLPKQAPAPKKAVHQSAFGSSCRLLGAFKASLMMSLWRHGMTFGDVPLCKHVC